MKEINLNEDDLQEIIVEVCKNNGVRVDNAYSIAEEVIEQITK